MPLSSYQHHDDTDMLAMSAAAVAAGAIVLAEEARICEIIAIPRSGRCGQR